MLIFRTCLPIFHLLHWSSLWGIFLFCCHRQIAVKPGILLSFCGCRLAWLACLEFTPEIPASCALRRKCHQHFDCANCAVSIQFPIFPFPPIRYAIIGNFHHIADCFYADWLCRNLNQKSVSWRRTINRPENRQIGNWFVRERNSGMWERVAN